MSDQPIKLGKSIKGLGAVTNHPSRSLAAAVELQSDAWGDGSDILTLANLQYKGADSA